MTFTPSFSLQGKCALVTGGSRGIGPDAPFWLKWQFGFKGNGTEKGFRF